MPKVIAQLMQAAAAARREGRLDEARRDLLEAEAVARAAGSPHDLAPALKALAQVERDLGHADAALPRLGELVALCRTEGEPLRLAHAIRHLGDLHREGRRWGAADRCYAEALSLYRAHRDAPPLDLANALRPLALLRQATGAAAEARALWEEARSLYESAGVPEGVSECDASLARLAPDVGSTPSGSP